VVTINAGWQSMRWIGAADLTGDGLADVVAIDSSWRMLVAVHSGVFDGTNTLRSGLVVVGYNWNVNDLVSVIGNGDRDGLLARRASDGKLVKYSTHGLDGIGTFYPPEPFDPSGRGEGRPSDVFIGMAPVTRYGGPDDFVYVDAAGVLTAQDPYFHWTTVVGYGWLGNDSIVLTNLDGDSWPDIIARDRSTGNLVGYVHEGSSTGTYVGPTVLGYGWQTNDIIG
jgi:hypothetical protein